MTSPTDRARAALEDWNALHEIAQDHRIHAYKPEILALFRQHGATIRAALEAMAHAPSPSEEIRRWNDERLREWAAGHLIPGSGSYDPESAERARMDEEERKQRDQDLASRFTRASAEGKGGE